MNVLVIGGTRFVGCLVVLRLLARGDRVTILNRGTRADPFGARVQRLVGDRRSELARLVAGKTFDAVVDFAAFEGPEVAEAVHKLVTGHYVFVSTGQVYLVREDCPRPAREGDYDGRVMPRPGNEYDAEEWDYGVGKRACEDVLAAARGFPSTRVRLPIVNGERDASRRLESYLWRIQDGGPVLLPDGGQHRLRHVYGADVARAIVGLLGDRRTFGQAYNLANEETPTLAELVALLARLLAAPDPGSSMPAARILAAGLTPRGVSPFSSSWQSFLDPTRAKRELGFQATPLEAQMTSIAAHFLASLPTPPPETYGTRGRELELARAT